MLKLIGADVCPFVQRVRLALHEKGLTFDYTAIDLRNKPDWYHEKLPTGRVPLLEHNQVRLWESSIICEYLEDAFPEPALLPDSPGPRARARLWIDWTSLKLVPAFYALLTGQEEQPDKLPGMLRKLEQEAFQGGDWLMGAKLTLVDLELYPWIERWDVLSHYRGLEFPAELSRLTSWRERMKQRDSVVDTANSPDYYVELYAHYAGGRSAYISGTAGQS